MPEAVHAGNEVLKYCPAQPKIANFVCDALVQSGTQTEKEVPVLCRWALEKFLLGTQIELRDMYLRLNFNTESE